MYGRFISLVPAAAFKAESAHNGGVHVVRVSNAGLANARPLPWTVVASAVCLVVYIVVMLFQPDVVRLLGYSMGGGGRTRAHMMARVVGALVVTWGIFQGARWAWWAATVFALLGSATGVLGVIYPGQFGQVHYLVDMITAPIALAAIMMLAVFLLLPQSKAFFFPPRVQ